MTELKITDKNDNVIIIPFEILMKVLIASFKDNSIMLVPKRAKDFNIIDEIVNICTLGKIEVKVDEHEDLGIGVLLKDITMN